jgi:hypothetical protein
MTDTCITSMAITLTNTPLLSQEQTRILALQNTNAQVMKVAIATVPAVVIKLYLMETM